MIRLLRRPAVAVLAVVAALASGCTGDEEQPRGETAQQGVLSPVECPRPVASALLGDASCRTLTVPENRETGAGTVSLLVSTLVPPNASDEAPIVVVGTDVGASLNYSGIAPMAQRTGLTVIFLEPRGVGYSVPALNCAPASDTLSWRVATGSARWVALVDDRARQCHEQLTTDGIDVSAFGVAEMAADVVDLIDALDLDRANLITYGSSSRVALEVMRHHSDQLRAVILDSPDLPGVDPGQFVEQQILSGARTVLRWCAEDQDCQASHPEPRSLLGRALAAVSEPVLLQLPVSASSSDGPSPVRLDAAMLVRLVRQVLTDGGSSGQRALPTALPALLESVASRDVRSLRSSAAQLLGRQGPLCPGYRPKCSPTHPVSDGAALTVLCGDVVPGATRAGGGPSRLPGYDNAYGDVALTSACSQWPVPAADPGTAEPVTSEVPTLLLAGGLAASTPAELVRQGAAGLTNASLVVAPTGSHNVIGSDCLLELRNRWLEDPRPLTEQPGCLDTRLEWK